jgi:hypothetical protein
VLRTIGNISEWLVQFTFLGVIIVLFLMLGLLLLLYGRDRIMDVLRIEPLKGIFDRLCAFSDRLYESYTAKNPYGNAMWLSRLIWIGVMVSGGLMALWIMVIAIRG